MPFLTGATWEEKGGVSLRGLAGVTIGHLKCCGKNRNGCTIAEVGRLDGAMRSVKRIIPCNESAKHRE